MATHDYVIANGTGAAVRSDLNNALAAIVSNNSSSSEPATTYAYQWWADTTANVLKIRNSANNAWITLRELDGTMLIEDGSASTPGLAFADDTNTGLFSPDADQIGFATGGAERLEIGSSEVVFNDPSNDVDFRVESNGQTHMLFVDAGNDAVGLGTSSPGDYLASAHQLVISDSASTGLTIATPTSSSGTIAFADGTGAGDNARGLIRYGHSDNSLQFSTNAAEVARFDSSGNLGVGTSSPIALLEVRKDVTTAYDSSSDNAQRDGTASISISNEDGSTNSFSQLVFDTAASGQSIARIVAIRTGNGSNDMAFVVEGSNTKREAMRINSSGNLGVGTTSPAHELHVADASTPEIVVEDTTNNVKAYLGASDTNGRVGTLSNDHLQFRTNDTERMRLDTSGQFLVGTTALPTDDNTALGFGVSSAQELRVGVNNGKAAMFKRASSAGTVVEFRKDGAVTGSISVTTSNTTSYNTSSDYRLKENVVDLDGAIARVKQLAPKRFNFIADDSTTVDGFLAHEAATVVPEAVTGTHNQVDDDDNPVYQGIDQSKLVPLLTAALQEAIAKIETLETKVAALEAG